MVSSTGEEGLSRLSLPGTVGIITPPFLHLFFNLLTFLVAVRDENRVALAPSRGAGEV